MLNSQGSSETRLHWFLRGLLIIGFLIAIGRLLELQFIKGSYYRSLAEGNRIRRIALKAPRGMILARGGESLVTNREVKKKLTFDLELGYQLVDDLSRPGEEIITWERVYPLAEKFAHIGGYVGKPSDTEIGKTNPLCPEKKALTSSDLIGRSGLESQYQCELKGIDGEELIEVDSIGRNLRVLGKIDPIPGENIRTNIDYGLQISLAESFEDKKGAGVITDPQGSVLALYSSPSFDPNKLIQKDNSKYASSIINNKGLPLFNRAIGGVYHPGSVFKPLVGLAALEEGKIDTSYTYNDTGVITIGDFSYSNWYLSQYGKTEGVIGLTRALARSTDTFFYKIGEIIGPDSISKWAKKFGLDSKTEIDIPGEVAGLVPSPSWKEKFKKERWFLGNTYHFAIGQGDLAVTPIEMSRTLAIIASKGQICNPRISSSQKEECQSLGISEKSISIIREGMIQACSSGGTGFTFFDFSPQVACKTGTAETNEDGKTPAWFSVFGPTDNPEIVATILVERGGEGSKDAGPIARKVFNYWFGITNTHQ